MEDLYVESPVDTLTLPLMPPELKDYDGQTCYLLPYARGVFPRETLYQLWQIMEEERAAPRVFHAQSCPVGVPFSWRGDLAAFCEWFSASGRFLIIAMAKVTPEIAGFMWFDELIPGHRANANLFFRRKYFGVVAAEAGRMAIRYAWHVLQVVDLWAFTPWREAAAYARRIGFRPVATLDNFQQIDGQANDMYILHLSKESYQARGDT